VPAKLTAKRSRIGPPARRTTDAEETERWKRNLSRVRVASDGQEEDVCVQVQARGQPRWRKGVAHACARTE
jgi:protoporphyrinogen oxidase